MRRRSFEVPRVDAGSGGNDRRTTQHILAGPEPLGRQTIGMREAQFIEGKGQGGPPNRYGSPLRTDRHVLPNLLPNLRDEITQVGRSAC